MATILMAAYTNYRRDPRVRREAEALVEAGHHVVFLASRQPGEPNRETIAGVDVLKAFGLKNRKTSAVVYMLDYALFFLTLFAHLLRHPVRYDLVHINNMPDFLVFAAVVPRVLGRPIIHDVHDLMPEIYEEKFGAGRGSSILNLLRLQERWAGQFATVVLTVEERLKDILSERGVAREKIHVLMNLPDHRIFSPRGSAPVKAADDPFVVVYHGTLARRLGLDVAIRAAAVARKQIARLELRIIGAGEEREKLIRLRDELGLADVVTFSEGFVPVEQIPALIRDADVGIVPLRISSGTDIMLPTKLLEYVSIGIPCIVPRTGTILRYFDEEMVEFFEAENVESLATAMVGLHQDRDRRLSLADAALQRFGRTYNWGVHRRVYTDLVEQLLSRHTREQSVL